MHADRNAALSESRHCAGIAQITASPIASEPLVLQMLHNMLLDQRRGKGAKFLMASSPSTK
jgi:hypothetical protein